MAGVRCPRAVAIDTGGVVMKVREALVMAEQLGGILSVGVFFWLAMKAFEFYFPNEKR
jgi:hypothetical protein